MGKLFKWISGGLSLVRSDHYEIIYGERASFVILGEKNFLLFFGPPNAKLGLIQVSALPLGDTG